MDKALLFKRRLPEDEVSIEGIGVVRVRALNRREAMETQRIEDPVERDHLIIALGLVDPRLTVSEVAQWAEASPAGEMEPVSVRIAEMSGMLPDSAKKAVKAFVADPEQEFRTLPSAEAVDDSGLPARGDVG